MDEYDHQLQAMLKSDEPDHAAAARIAPKAMATLRELAAGKDSALAARAVYVAGLLGADGADLVAKGAAHKDAFVRMSAAGTCRNLDPKQAGPVLDRLLQDKDAGVRKFAVKACIHAGGPAHRKRLEAMASQDPEEFLRALARDAIPQMRE